MAITAVAVFALAAVVIGFGPERRGRTFGTDDAPVANAPI